ncbi:MAG: hypothetical protein E5V80_27555, partial [Mesorhizobium sp.]
ERRIRREPPPIAFIYVGIVIASAFCLFVLWRVTAGRPTPAATSGSFAPMSAQTPLPVELAFAPDEKPRQD